MITKTSPHVAGIGHATVVAHDTDHVYTWQNCYGTYTLICETMPWVFPECRVFLSVEYHNGDYADLPEAIAMIAVDYLYQVGYPMAYSFNK